MFLDADAWVSRFSAVEIERYLQIAPDAEIFFTQGRSKPRMVLMNGGMHILKNTAAALSLAEGWWSERCGVAYDGGRDQPSLWRTVFNLLQSWTNGEFKYDIGKMTGDKAREYALPHFKQQHREMARTGLWACPEGKCWNGDHLKEPIKLDKLVILSQGSTTLPDGSTVPGFHEDLGDKSAPTLVCHAKPGRHGASEPNQCNPKAICMGPTCLTKLQSFAKITEKPVEGCCSSAESDPDW